MQVQLQTFYIPVFCCRFRRGETVCNIFNIFCDHIIDGISHALAVENPSSLSVNDLSLLVHNLIILKQIFTDTEVVCLQFFLCCLYRIGKHLMLQLFPVCNTQRIKSSHKTVRTEQTKKIIFQ